MSASPLTPVLLHDWTDIYVPNTHECDWFACWLEMDRKEPAEARTHTHTVTVAHSARQSSWPASCSTDCRRAKHLPVCSHVTLGLNLGSMYENFTQIYVSFLLYYLNNNHIYEYALLACSLFLRRLLEQMDPHVWFTADGLHDSTLAKDCSLLPVSNLEICMCSPQYCWAALHCGSYCSEL